MPNPPKMNILDRTLAQIAPQYALKRRKAQVALALSGGLGGYSGAGYHERLYGWQPGVADADSATIRDLRELRARSRDLVRNSPIASGAIETQVINVVGSGLRLQARVDAELLGLSQDEADRWQKNVEREFWMWATSTMCDAHGQQDFYGIQDLAFRSHLESGDSFVLLTQVSRPNWPYRLALQVVEADRVCNPQNKADTQTMVAGIEKDSQGFPLAVHIAKRHPGAYVVSAETDWTRVAVQGRSGRRNVIHLMRKLRPGQTRGVPCLAPIIEPLKQLTRYSQAEVDAAVNSAVYALFAKMDSSAFDEIFTDDAQKAAYLSKAMQWDGSVDSGKVVNLLPGESIESPVQNRPNPNFDPFVGAVMRQIGVGLNIPFEVLTKHFSSSYSAARAALLDAWKTFKTRRSWLANRLCQPVYEEWLADAVASGRIQAPGFFTDPAIRSAWCMSQWSGDGPGAIDPVKEVEAAKRRVDMGLTTLAEEVLQYDGGDWFEKHQEATRIKQERVDSGLEAPQVDPNAPVEGEDDDDAEPPSVNVNIDNGSSPAVEQAIIEAMGRL